MQLKIYGFAIGVVKDVGAMARVVAREDGDLARQLRRCSSSVDLNIAEGETARGGNRGQRFDTAIGSARESVAVMELAEALGYLEEGASAGARDGMDRIVATLWKLKGRR